ncbi:MAG: amidohydrolase family protein [Bacteriovoracales bacterium]|nr:amidohydrolase family protein [Bacteriovoracales bacterium]
MKPKRLKKRTGNKIFFLFVTITATAIGVFWLLFTFSKPADISVTSLKTPITDMHIHTAGLGHGGSGIIISDRLRQSYKMNFYLKAFRVSEGELKKHGDTFVLKVISELISKAQMVDKAVILALDGVVNSKGELDRKATEVYVPNDFLIKELPKYPNLLLGASINPFRHDAIKRLEKVAAHGAVLIKWIPNIMNIDPSDARIEPFYRALAAHGIPLLTHTGAEASFTSAHNEWGDPKRLELPLSLGVTVIAAHVATTGKIKGREQFERILPLFKKHPNLYADISSLTQINKWGYLKRVMKAGIGKQLVYGSDWPLQFWPLVSPWYYLHQLSLSELKAITDFSNPFDRDILLKSALGVPNEVFTRWDKILR